MSDRKIRPFVAEMPRPLEGESLLGLFSRALDRTAIIKLKQGLGLGGVELTRTPTAINIAETNTAGLAILFGTDPCEIQERLHLKTTFGHARGAAIDFFGTTIRPQYLETVVRRVSPRALIASPHHRAIWDIRLFCFDPETGERLLDACPVCSNPLGWTYVRGPAYCDKCVGENDSPTTDLRDHPQPVLEIADQEAIDFVVGLVDPLRDRRERFRRLLPAELATATNSEIFEAVVCIISSARAENIRKKTAVGRPHHAPEFKGITPEIIALAGRAIIGGEEGFAVLADRMRTAMADRTLKMGLSKELGPLAAATWDPLLAPTVRGFFTKAIERDMARTGDLGLIRKGNRTVKAQRDGTWLNMDAASRQMGISKHALVRLAESGRVSIRRAEALTSPIMMRRDEIAPIVSLYHDASSELAATAILRIHANDLQELADRDLIQRIEGPVKIMLEGKTHYRTSSLRAVAIAIDKRAKHTGQSSAPSENLLKASRRLPDPISWAAIIALILSGDIAIRRLRKTGSDWRTAVAPVDIETFETLAKLQQANGSGSQSEWMTRGQAAQIMKVDETGVWAMAKAGLLPKRDGHRAMFKRSDVEAACKIYILMPEMIERSVFNIGHEVGRWLKSVDVRPVSPLHQKRYPIYDRSEFERVLPSQPAALNDVVVPDRGSRRVSTDVKRKAVEAVKSGLTPHHVAQRIGVNRSAVAKWVAYFETHGHLQPATKLETYQDEIRARIEANPALSTRQLWLNFNGRVKVGYTKMSSCIRDLGYHRDGVGRLVRRD